MLVTTNNLESPACEVNRGDVVFLRRKSDGRLYRIEAKEIRIGFGGPIIFGLYSNTYNNKEINGFLNLYSFAIHKVIQCL